MPTATTDRAADDAFRADVRAWLAANVVGEFAEAAGAGGPGSEHEAVEVRMAWERHLGESGWTCLGWPTSAGGRGASVRQQMIWHEEYAAAGAPARVGIFGEGLLGPTLIAHGTEAQRRRFLDPIRRGTELWCQGYSEPDAGSDLANVQTRAVLDGDEWVVTGHKVWTSLAHWADWCFVVCRTTPGSTRHKGLSYLLVPMRQPGVEVRPIRQLTGTAEFNEVFFDEARTPADMVVGRPGDGWRVAMATLAFERGAGLLGHFVHFNRELQAVVETARRTGRDGDPLVRQRIADAWGRLRIFRWNVERSLSGAADGDADAGTGPEASIAKLFWSTWHRQLGELAVDVLGPAAAAGEDASATALVRAFLASRADTIYGGSNQVQRTVIGERVLGLPAEPKPSAVDPGGGPGGAVPAGAVPAGADGRPNDAVAR